ncbi:hypothetical protein KBZ33_17165, partial [Cyanobium sp. Cruz-8D1]|nr:hypothetical protein [Cyanobium sp. Cruz-8H5]MCP9867998.1 hypothetical protein [Cyanobium sp. Cruz-8D1]
ERSGVSAPVGRDLLELENQLFHQWHRWRDGEIDRQELQSLTALVIRDLRVLAQGLDGEVFHYRDDYGVEVDAIVQLRDGRWGAIDIRLGQGQVEAAAEGLLRFRQQIDTGRTGEPAFLAVVCGSGYGYRRAEGIAVVPLGALGP